VNPMERFDNKFDRYRFSALPSRPRYTWPNGARLAVYFALNVEAFEFGRNPGNDFTSMPSPPFHRGYAYRDYGNRVGIWRIADLFERQQVPLSVLVNASVYDVCPEILVPFRERGDEFVGHGRTNSERQADMDVDTERRMLAQVRDRLTREEGKAPKGWLGPFISQSANTPELLHEAGFTYMLDWFFDEQPQWFRTGRGPILAVPYPSMELNDLPAFINRGASDTEFTSMVIDAFDQQLEDSDRHGWPLVCCISIHTFLMGHPHRARQLARMLAHLNAQRSRVWFATPGQIADHVAGLPAGTVALP